MNLVLFAQVYAAVHCRNYRSGTITASELFHLLMETATRHNVCRSYAVTVYVQTVLDSEIDALTVVEDGRILRLIHLCQQTSKPGLYHDEYDEARRIVASLFYDEAKAALGTYVIPTEPRELRRSSRVAFREDKKCDDCGYYLSPSGECTNRVCREVNG